MPLDQDKMAQPCALNGVGHGSQIVEYGVELTIGLQDTQGDFHREVYRAPCIGGWGGPRLIGIQSLERNDALIRCSTGETGSLERAGLKSN